MKGPAVASGGAEWPADALEVSRVVDAWGLKGWVRIQPFSSDPQVLLAARRWHLLPPEAGGPPRRPGAAAWPASVDVAEVKFHGDSVVARIEGVADRTAAEALRGARIFVPRSSFPKPGADEFYWVDLIGLEVENRAGEPLGRVVGLLDNGPQSVLRVAPAGAAPGTAGAAASAPSADERLIPFVAAYVDDVDLVGRRITVDWGLDF